jgi:serine carboxypeptidase-like clade 2
LNYTSNVPSVIPIYQQLIARNYKILIYSGDTDGAVPYTGTAAWTASKLFFFFHFSPFLNSTHSMTKKTGLGLPLKYEWQPWSIQDMEGPQTAGYATAYDGLTFVTVKGSGHMVPQFRPIAAFYMFQQFITGGQLNI